MNFSRPKQGLSDHIKVISKALKYQLEDILKIEANLMTSNELKFLKQRLKFLTKDIVLTDTEGKSI